MTTITDKLAQNLHSIFRGNPNALAAANGKAFRPVECQHDWKYIRPHVEGGQCWGFYLLSSKDECFVSCIDVDNHIVNGTPENPNWREETEALLESLEKVDSSLEPLVEISQSGEGAHIWLRSAHGVKARTFRRLWKKVGKTANLKVREIYPRQDQRSGKNFGNLVRFPLWNKSRFVDVWHSWEKLDSLEALEGFPAVEEEELLSVVGGDGSGASGVSPSFPSELPPTVLYLVEQEGTTAWKRWNLDHEGLVDDTFSAIKYSFIGTLHTWGVQAHEIVTAVRALERKAGREPRDELTIRKEVDKSIESPVAGGGRRRALGKSARPLPNLEKIRKNLKTLDSVEKKDIPWIWENRIPAEGVTLIYGQAGSFKTWFGLEILRHVVHGLEWEDGSSCPKGRAAYLTTEDSESAIRERAELIGVDTSRVTFLDTAEDQIAFQDVKHLLTLDELADVRVIVIDPCDGHLDDGADTNKAADVRIALESVKNLTTNVGEAGTDSEPLPVSVIAIHHTSKPQDGRTKLQAAAGSRSWVAVPRTCIHVERKGGTVPRLEWTWTKANSSRQHPGTVVSYFNDGFEYHTFNKEAINNED